MDPAALVPTPDTIPVAWGWFQFLLMLTFVLHLLVMNAMLGSGIIALVTHWTHPDGSPAICRLTAGKLTYLIAFAVNFGVAPLLFLQVLYGQFLYTSSVLMAWHWLAVIALLILAYGAAYLYALKYKPLGRARSGVLWLVVLPLLLIGFIFSNNMTLMLRPDAWRQYFDQPNGTLLNLADPTLFPRYLHMIIGAIAIGGLFLALMARYQLHESPHNTEKSVSTGLNWFAIATLVQFWIGAWLLAVQPAPIRTLLLGGSPLATTFLALAVAGGLAAMLLALSRRLIPTVAVAVLTVILMTLVRDLMRRASLAPYFAPADLTMAAQTQYGLMILFFILLLVTVAIIVYLLRLAAVATREEVC